jgi:hypothetical protein
MSEIPPAPSSALGRFRLRRPLGVGASSVVYEAFDERDQVSVALKAIKSCGTESLSRLRRELEALRGISHPNLLRLGELYVDANTTFLSMELVNGQDFLAYVRPEQAANPGLAFDETRLRSAFAQLASGLLALHAAGRVHRDVKPGNVLVTDAGRVVLLDFGLVSDADQDSAQAADAVGTVLYMAPEQGAGKAVGPEADWYSVGVVLYQALTGVPPFSGANLQILIDKQQGDPEPVRAREPRAPADLCELCSELLRFDPTQRPSGRAVLRRLGAFAHEESARPSTHTLTAPLRGRQAECEQLDRLLATVRGGRPVQLLLCGREGTGKSRLMSALCTRARDAGAHVLFGRPGTTRPYNAIHAVAERVADLLRDHENQTPLSEGDMLRRAFAALEDAPCLGASDSVLDPQELRVRMFRVARELFHRLASKHTLVLALDDFDQCDADSRALLSEVLRAPDAPPLLLLTSQTELSESARPLLSSGSEVRELAPLGRADAELLSRDLLRIAGREDRAAEVVEKAGGSPLLVEQLVRLIASGAELTDLPGLAEAVHRRTQALPEQALRAARLLALSPEPVPVSLLAHALGASAAESSRLVSLLSLLGFTHNASHAQGETLSLAHRSFAKPLLHGLDAEERKHMHLLLARVLEGSAQPDSELLAHHYAGADIAARAASYALSAAEAAEKNLAFARAAALFARAQRFLPDRSPELRNARQREGRALASAGLNVRAATAFGRAREGATAGQALELGQRAAQQLFHAGQILAGEQMLRATLAPEAVSYPSTPWRALLLWVLDLLRLKLRGLGFRRRKVAQISSHVLTRIDACIHAGIVLAVSDNIRCNYFVLRALLDALRTGEPQRVTRALSLHATTISTAGVRAEAKSNSLFRTAQRLSEESGATPYVRALIGGGRGQASLLMGRFKESFELCAEAEAILRKDCADVPWELNVVRMSGARALQYMGEFRELAGRLPSMLEECRQRGDLFGEVSLLVSVQAPVLLADDSPHDALKYVLEGQRLWHAEGFHVQHYYALSGRAMIALYEGNDREAYDRSCEILRGMERSLLGRIQFVRVVSHAACGTAALSLVRSSRDGRALSREVRRLAKRILAERAAWATPQAEVLLACLAYLDGRPQQTVQLLLKAAAGFDAVHMAMHAAVTRRRLGELLGGGEGRRLMSQADTFMAEQGVRDPLRFTSVFVPALWPALTTTIG